MGVCSDDSVDVFTKKKKDFLAAAKAEKVIKVVRLTSRKGNTDKNLYYIRGICFGKCPLTEKEKGNLARDFGIKFLYSERIKTLGTFNFIGGCPTPFEDIKFHALALG